MKLTASRAVRGPAPGYHIVITEENGGSWLSLDELVLVKLTL